MPKLLTLFTMAFVLLSMPFSGLQAQKPDLGPGLRVPDLHALDAMTRSLADQGPYVPMTSAGTTGCLIRDLNCNQTVLADINFADCATEDLGTFFDIWAFQGTDGDQVTIRMDSQQLDPFLLLFDPDINVHDQDDDSGPGLNARIRTTLDETGLWSFSASGLPGLGQTGSYSLSLECSSTQPPPPPPPTPGDCASENDPSDTLCLSNERFQVQVDWRTSQGTTGTGTAVPLTSDTGYFWFFNQSNVEMVIKVINACSFANRFWVFAGGLTDVEVEIRVTDTLSSQTRIYGNELGRPFQPIQDTNAFATCP